MLCNVVGLILDMQFAAATSRLWLKRSGDIKNERLLEKTGKSEEPR